MDDQTSTPTPTPIPVHLDDGDALESFVASHGTCLVEFYTKGCSLCQAMESVLGNVARSTGVSVGMMNPRDDPELIERFGVRSVPKFVVFHDGEQVASRADGFLGGDELTAFLETHAPAMDERA
ncbi:thioredoxin [Natrialba magadii ATCC 43099]|uniref:Thioredoxin n=1 Tax=Natrialba magadii (strain ATCC 43099 / DSM 3394 / CCM 3739 / CIP 104546 / IAM 13178 / JCM 8861 / NBRC 102185 / NCIMB 2190 / MS3) TaxID=547559 RepID=D3ST66_NATMM|nr:thioredoxin family protein [Natrialba magadii]ADD06933.1 thioredoxin [Natrialba magadii ATCC 43099]ELY28443.1 thioredoxin [Natrialba magadii ATCC 43099]